MTRKAKTPSGCRSCGNVALPQVDVFLFRQGSRNIVQIRIQLNNASARITWFLTNFPRAFPWTSTSVSMGVHRNRWTSMETPWTLPSKLPWKSAEFSVEGSTDKTTEESIGVHLPGRFYPTHVSVEASVDAPQKCPRKLPRTFSRASSDMSMETSLQTSVENSMETSTETSTEVRHKIEKYDVFRLSSGTVPLVFMFLHCPPSSCGACLLPSYSSREEFDRTYTSSTLTSLCVHSSIQLLVRTREKTQFVGFLTSPRIKLAT